MGTKVSLLVSPCVKGTAPGEGRIFGERLVDRKMDTVEEATRLGHLYRVVGQSVVVRPNYNEEDEKGKFFREWRSFNGEPFREVRWLHDSQGTGG